MVNDSVVNTEDIIVEDENNNSDFKKRASNLIKSIRDGIYGSYINTINNNIGLTEDEENKIKLDSFSVSIYKTDKTENERIKRIFELLVEISEILKNNVYNNSKFLIEKKDIESNNITISQMFSIIISYYGNGPVIIKKVKNNNIEDPTIVIQELLNKPNSDTLLQNKIKIFNKIYNNNNNRYKIGDKTLILFSQWVIELLETVWGETPLTEENRGYYKEPEKNSEYIDTSIIGGKKSTIKKKKTKKSKRGKKTKNSKKRRLKGKKGNNKNRKGKKTKRNMRHKRKLNKTKRKK